MSWREINRRIEECKKLVDPSDRLTCLLRLWDLYKETDRDGMVAYAIGEEFENQNQLEESLKYYKEAERRFPLPAYQERARSAIAGVQNKLEAHQMLGEVYELIENHVEKTPDYLRKIAEILVHVMNAYLNFNAKLRCWGSLPDQQTLRSLPVEEKEGFIKGLAEKVKREELSIDAPLSLARATTEEMDKLRMEAVNLEVPERFREMHFQILVTLSDGVASFNYLEEAMRRGDHSMGTRL